MVSCEHVLSYIKHSVHLPPIFLCTLIFEKAYGENLFKFMQAQCTNLGWVTPSCLLFCSCMLHIMKVSWRKYWQRQYFGDKRFCRWRCCLPNLLSWFHQTIQGVKTLRFTTTCYIETSNQYRHFLDRKIIGIYNK